MSTHHDAQHAKELLVKSMLHEESPARREAHTHMWAAVAVCSLVIVAAYGLVVVRNYDFFEAKQSFVAAAHEVQDLGTKLAPVTEQPKIMWNSLQENLAKEAEVQIEANVIEEMKKNIEANTSTTVALPVAEESKPTPSGKK